MADKDKNGKREPEEIEGKGFVVKDRRRFTQDESGEVKQRPEAEQPAEQPKAGPAEPTEPRTEPRTEPPADEPAASQAAPEINFINFVLSLSTSAMVHLGDIPDPFSNTQEQNLPVAKQTIDILGMIEEKTRGNLDKDEESVITNALYQLRVRYVELMRGAPEGPDSAN